MATVQAVATRRAIALQKLEEVTGAISEKLGVGDLSIKTNNRDAALAEVERIEGVVDYLEQLLQPIAALESTRAAGSTSKAKGK